MTTEYNEIEEEKLMNEIIKNINSRNYQKEAKDMYVKIIYHKTNILEAAWLIPICDFSQDIIYAKESKEG